MPTSIHKEKVLTVSQLIWCANFKRIRRFYFILNFKTPAIHHNTHTHTIAAMIVSTPLFHRLPSASFTTLNRRTSYRKPSRFSTTITCVGWDPEGVLRPPEGGHIARLEFKKKMATDSNARADFERQVREENERRRAVRDSRGVPKTAAELVEYFLDTEAREIEFEIAKMRPRLSEEFFSHVKLELGKLRFAVNKTQDVEDRVAELELLQKALLEGTEAYDKMQADLVTAQKSLREILTSQDIKTTLLDMVERNELNRSLLTILDENIASASMSNQKDVADYMYKIRGLVVKYITL